MVNADRSAAHGTRAANDDARPAQPSICALAHCTLSEYRLRAARDSNSQPEIRHACRAQGSLAVGAITANEVI